MDVNKNPGFSRLFTLKELLTLDDAAKQLSTVLEDQDISVPDLLDLALNHHLKLSVLIVNGTYAHPERVVGEDEVRYFESYFEPGVKILGSTVLDYEKGLYKL